MCTMEQCSGLEFVRVFVLFNPESRRLQTIDHLKPYPSGVR
jgi:hypothetical protein